MTNEEIVKCYIREVERGEWRYLDRYKMKMSGLTPENISIVEEDESCRKIWYKDGYRVLDLCGDPIDEENAHLYGEPRFDEDIEKHWHADLKKD